MAEMKYLPSPKKRIGVFGIGLILGGLLILYALIGNSTGSENLQLFVREKSQAEVVRYVDFPVGERSRVIMIRDQEDNRTAMAFVKFPLFDRWNMTGFQTVSGKETRPISLEIDDGFAVFQSEVSFDRVRVLSKRSFSGSFAKTVSVLLFILLAVGINWWLSKYRRNKVV